MKRISSWPVTMGGSATSTIDDISLQPRPWPCARFLPTRPAEDSRTSAAEAAGFVRAVAEAARLEGVTAAGYRLIANAGENGHQEVQHFHMHLLGGRRMGRMVQPARE